VAAGDTTIMVNVVLEDRAYGGPEEGGWWYDTGEVMQVIPTDSLESAGCLIEWLKAGRFSNEGRPEVSSVLSCGQFDFKLSFQPLESYPNRRPHYE
jgi:hypothetical protein